MKTRRSWRNQDRLFTALFKPPPVVPMEEPACCWNCTNYPKGGRNRGACTLIGEMVNGRSVKPCYRRAEGKVPR